MFIIGKLELRTLSLKILNLLLDFLRGLYALFFFV